VSLNLRQLYLCDTLHSFSQDRCFVFKLTLVSRVLVMASTTLAKIWTGWRRAHCRWNNNSIELRTRESGAVFDNGDVHLFAGQCEWDKNGLPSSVVAFNARQPIAAVHEFFNREFQILTTETQSHRVYK
jgi:hypothetical protein